MVTQQVVTTQSKTARTLLVLSALLSAALTNIRSGQADPLAIVIPGGLWILMGISATSLVGAPLVLSGKKSRNANDEQTKRTLDLLARQNVNIDTITTMGQVIVNISPQNACWADLFSGEETGNAAQFDLGKMQLFYFTMILVLVYAVALGSLFVGPVRVIGMFPEMDTSWHCSVSATRHTWPIKPFLIVRHSPSGGRWPLESARFMRV